MGPSNIHILPEDLINKIAAGEVIERPASVVKELVENAIDAGSPQITIEVQGAGQKSIRVSDKGRGMTQEECQLALQRHATSKISQLDDLFNIQTLGFRGEALPSIASVSHLKLEPNPSGQGITVVVKDLFYNTPARKKFMKSPTTELGHISDIVAKYALANPQIAFEYISDGKPMLVTAGSGRLKDTVAAVYGADLAKNLIAVEKTFGFGKINGLVSHPTLTRIDKGYEVFFVNHRYIKNFLLNRALEDAYRTLIPSARYPVCILFVEIDPKQIDVNVHPSKREVKFAKTNEVMEAVRETVRTGLSHLLEGSQGTEQTTNSWTPSPPHDQLSMSGSQDSFLPQNSAPDFQAVEFTVTAIQPFMPLYALKNTYIVATDGEELVLIDQHAAHERIIYDELGKQGTEHRMQTLLMPETIEMGPKESLVLQENLACLRSLSFELEEFGNKSFLLRSIPAAATKTSAKQLLLDIVAELGELGKSAQLEVRQENIRKTIACKAAVKAGDKLNQTEMNQLIKDLFSTENPSTCPHGRPTIIRVTEEELKKRFGR
ncbi:MAG: DNA mismatch repair endonuclease MutL [Candidatus Margulisiibacteriota bacterium]